jgi:hypothetical protein
MTRPKAVMHPIGVVATRDSNGGYRFQSESELTDGADDEFHFHKDRHGMKSHDYHLVEFVLDDRTGDDLKFPPVPHDAMWVAEAGNPSDRKCPDMDTVSDYSVMEPICVTGDRKRLIVRNENPREEQWAFTLNFVKRGEDDADRGHYVNWDPVGSNHNGGS